MKYSTLLAISAALLASTAHAGEFSQSYGYGVVSKGGLGKDTGHYTKGLMAGQAEDAEVGRLSGSPTYIQQTIIGVYNNSNINGNGNNVNLNGSNTGNINGSQQVGNTNSFGN